MNNPEYTINFIKGYQLNYGWNTAQSKGICKQIATENGIPNGATHHHYNTKKRALAKFAELMLKVVDIIDFDRDSVDYKTLKEISKGKIYIDTSCDDAGFGAFEKTMDENIKYTAIMLDTIIDKIIKEYDKKNS
jgi:hypothetical protein